MSDAAIETAGLRKDYDHGRVRPLDSVDLRVERGEFVALTGPSGCGKSTLLHLLAALDKPTSGTILINGTELSRRRDINRYRRSELGLVFQLHNLIPRLTARENVELAMFGTGRSAHTRKHDATALLDLLHLGQVADRVPPRLSGGERQRVAIARALANNPSILLADEPTGSLDTQSIDTVMGMFEQARTERGATVLMVTHDIAVARRADRIVELHDGHIWAHTEPTRGERA
jgi:putative ABC transport system ATP-binding protein